MNALRQQDHALRPSKTLCTVQLVQHFWHPFLNLHETTNQSTVQARCPFQYAHPASAAVSIRVYVPSAYEYHRPVDASPYSPVVESYQ
jgi:hypothetical protein